MASRFLARPVWFGSPYYVYPWYYGYPCQAPVYYPWFYAGYVPVYYWYPWYCYW